MHFLSVQAPSTLAVPCAKHPGALMANVRSVRLYLLGGCTVPYHQMCNENRKCPTGDRSPENAEEISLGCGVTLDSLLLCFMIL